MEESPEGLLDGFGGWFEERDEWLRGHGFTVERTLPPKDWPYPNPSVYADLIDRRYYARVTVWESGFCDRIVLDYESAEQILFEHSELSSVADLHAALAEFCRRLIAGEFRHPEESTSS
jgi:hypothetical protein